MSSSDLRGGFRGSCRGGMCDRIRRASALWLGIGAVALGACSSVPVSEITPAPSQTTTSTARPSPVTTRPPSPQAPVVLARSTSPVLLKGTYTFDFEGGGSGTTAGSDVWWQLVDVSTRYLVPQNGALLARLGATDLDARTASELVSVPYDRRSLNGSSSPALNQLTQGTVIAIRTRHGHYARMQVVAYGVDLVISWVTYQ
jgi:hypothetical protein